ncbi:MAG TPA: glycosyltransferase [Steroidobacteraceae bacterium]|jgi:glycosyltransferase involved in cell wall biosynthesis|nr:glycosyltransferase [Steroidobacteraceae bacterium]
MSPVLFYDPVCQQPYDTRTLHVQALGGTEATLVRVADALGAWVMQHNRTQDWQRYRRPQRLAGISHVVVNRDSRALPFVQQHYPHARVYLWLHDRLHPRARRARWLAATAPLLRARAVTAVCVSEWQRSGVEATLRSIGVADVVSARTIYNPVDDALQPDNTPVDPEKLVFFSSPNKGLNFALDAFRELRRALPRLRLAVGNPGYREAGAVPSEGIELLGAQPQSRMHQQVRGALCTFFPNFLIPETFGLVFAESHALGTPVLTHDCGAAPEIVADPQQLLPVSAAARCYEALVGDLPTRWRAGPARLAAAAGLFDAYLERIRQWRAGARPHAAPDARFRLSAITEQWLRLLS